MSDEYTASLQEIAGPDWPLWDSATHWQMARQLREMANIYRLPDPRDESLSLARRYELRAESLKTDYLTRDHQRRVPRRPARGGA